MTSVVGRLEGSFTLRQLQHSESQDRALRDVRCQAPALGAVLDEAAESVRRDGAVMLRDVPCGSDQALVALAATLGPVLPDEPGHPMVDAVVPLSEADDPGRRAANNRQALTPHTDRSVAAAPPDYLVLACVYGGAPPDSGQSVVVRVDDVIKVLESQGLGRAVELLQDPVFPVVDVPAIKGQQARMTSIVGRRDDGGFTVRYRGECVEAGMAAAGSPSDAHRSAFAAFRREVESAEAQRTVQLAAGDALWLDNRRVLHGRTAIARGTQRLLKRLCVGGSGGNGVLAGA
jgi:alpha-ketoglutarate-dependent taurine dioxygenase